MLDVKDLPIVPWYREAEIYDWFRETANDKVDFFETWQQWHAIAMEHENAAARNGVTIVRILMTREAFTDTGLINDAAGRMEFAQRVASRLLS